MNRFYISHLLCLVTLLLLLFLKQAIEFMHKSIHKYVMCNLLMTRMRLMQASGNQVFMMWVPHPWEPHSVQT